MATIDATVAGASANSYITEAEGDTFADERLQTSNWDDATSADKISALIMATRRLDDEKYQGLKDTDGQALKWPRINATNDDGEEFATDAIPDIVKEAQFELALHYLNENASSTDPLAPTGLEQFDEATVGPMSVKIRRGFSAVELPDSVRRKLRPVLRTAVHSGRLVRA